ncbi:MAG TPA: hypothetical protein VF487_13585 [Chitinophagaceae bacterium]
MKKLFVLPMLTIIAVFAIVLGTSAFKSNKKASVKFSSEIAKNTNPVKWYFVGVPGEEDEPAKYQLDPPEEFDCGGNGPLCSIMDVQGTTSGQPALTYGVPIPSNEDYEEYSPELRIVNPGNRNQP